MDRYTKVMLTVIALSLLWISVQLTSPIPNAYALDTARVDIADISVSKQRALPVHVTGELTCKSNN